MMNTNFDTTAYCRYVLNCLKEDGLLGDNRVESQLSTDKLKEYCRSRIESALYKEAVTTVDRLDNIVSDYQQRYNLVGSVSKAFYTQADNKKQYQYLSVEPYSFFERETS